MVIPHVSCDVAEAVELKTTGFYDNVASHAMVGVLFNEDGSNKC